MLNPQKTTLSVMLLDTQPNCERLSKLFHNMPPEDYDLHFTSKFDQACDWVKHRDFDALLLPYKIDNHVGLNLILEARYAGRSTPAILLSADRAQIKGSILLHTGYRETLNDDQLTPTLLDRKIRYSIAEHASRRVLSDAKWHAERALPLVSDAVILLDKETRIHYLNPAAEKMLDLEKTTIWQQALGEYIRFFNDDQRDITQQVIQPNPCLRIQENVTLQNHRGKKFQSELNVTPFSATGMSDGSFVIIRNTDKHIDAATARSSSTLYDELTGLLSRGAFIGRLKQTINVVQRTDNHFAILFIDLDGFKSVNDTLGHSYGDILLQHVGERLNTCIRDTDTLARLGGDEFTVLLSSLSSADHAAIVAANILHTLSAPFNLMGLEASIGASIGIASFPNDGRDTETLLKNADTAMYHAKDLGKNNFQYYTPSLNAEAKHKLRLITDLRRAIDADEFELHYQPQVDATTQEVIGLEALMRWYHPVFGFVSPADFIPLAEESGRMIAVGDWVLGEVCRQQSIWRSHGTHVEKIAVNISVRQLERGFIDRLLDNLEKHKVEKSEIELEITESIFALDQDAILKTLNELKSLGFSIALDDFGTGYSSLSYLGKLPIDTIKIDRGFVRGLSDHHNKAVVKTIIAMAHQLDMDIVAEGVETVQQRDFLLNEGCRIMQGYFYYKPVSASKITRYVKFKERP